MANDSMRSAPFRDGAAAARDLIMVHRPEIDRLCALSSLKRALLPEDLVRELAELQTHIEAALARPPSTVTAALVEQLAPRISAALARSDEEVSRLGERPRQFPLPPPPPAIGLFEFLFTFPSGYVTMAADRAFADAFPDADSLRPYGAGMLARFERDGAPFALAARGRRLAHPLLFQIRKIDCTLWTPAPPLPTVVVTWHRTAFLPTRTVIAFERDFNRCYLVAGDEPVARALLDVSIRRKLIGMRFDAFRLSVANGVLELTWSQRFPTGARVLPDELLGVATSIAKRLYAP